MSPTRRTTGKKPGCRVGGGDGKPKSPALIWMKGMDGQFENRNDIHFLTSFYFFGRDQESVLGQRCYMERC